MYEGFDQSVNLQAEQRKKFYEVRKLHPTDREP